MYEYDVVIVGGGVSGAVAGIASAKAGARTIIVEKMGFLGGALTASGVGPMMTFHAGENQVVRGIPEEIIENLKKLGGTPGHVVDTTGYTYTVTPFDAELLKHVLERMYTNAGGDILFHSMLSSVVKKNGDIDYIKVTTKSDELNFKGKVYIDATGDGDFAAKSGVDFQLGRPKDNLCQPVTTNFKVRNVNIKEVKKYILSHPEEFPPQNIELIDKAPRFSCAGYVKDLNEAINKGELSFHREVILFFETNNEGEVIVNTTRIQKVNPTDPFEVSKAEIEGRKQVLELYNLLRNKISGFENCVLEYSGPNIGVRESRKIKGEYTLSADDLFEDKYFEDEIARGGYPVDVHSPDGEGTNSKHLSYGASYGIPYGSLINPQVKNIITVGRCISATHEACAAIRVSPIAMAIGQAGGTAAAICANENKNAYEIDFNELRKNLKENGAYIK